MSDFKAFLKEMFIDEAKPALERYSGGSGGDGGFIEVDTLPEVGEENTVYKLVKQVGTAIPTSDLVEKAYFNKNMSNEEIISLCDKYCSIPIDESGEMLIYPIVVDITNYKLIVLQKNNLDDGNIFYQLAMLKFNASSGEFGQDDTTPTIWVYTNINEDLQGFKLENDYLELNWTTYYDFNGVPIGNNNDKIVDLVSITPFEEKEEYYIYDSTNVENEYEFYGVSYGQIFELTYAIKAEAGAQVATITVVDTLPNVGVETQSDFSEVHVYYVKNDKLYMYSIIGSQEGELVWSDFAQLMGLPFKGEVASVDNISLEETAIYAVVTEGNPWKKISADVDKQGYLTNVIDTSYIYKGTTPRIESDNGNSVTEAMNFLIKVNDDSIEVIIADLIYCKYYKNVGFKYSSSSLTKYTANQFFDNKGANYIVIPEPLMFSVSNNSLTGALMNFEFKLDGSQAKLKDTYNEEVVFYRQKTNDEWNSLILTLGVPEITEDTEV